MYREICVCVPLIYDYPPQSLCVFLSLKIIPKHIKLNLVHIKTVLLENIAKCLRLLILYQYIIFKKLSCQV